MSAALPAFDYQRLDAFKVAREALRLGERTRAPTSAWLCHHTGPTPPRASQRVPWHRGSLQPAKVPTGCAASAVRAARHARPRPALEGVLVLNLAPEAEILTLLALLDRLCAHAYAAGPTWGERPCRASADRPACA